MKKKLTSTKGFPLVMTVVAFLLSAAAAAQEFIAKLIYENIFKNPTWDFVLLIDDDFFFDIYGFSAFSFLLAFLIMIVYMASASKPSIGAKGGLLTMFAGLALAVVPALNFAIKADEGLLEFSGSDGVVFRQVNSVICYLAPVVVGLLIALAGLGLIIKAGGRKSLVFTAEIPVLPQAESADNQAAALAAAAVVPVVEEAAVQAEKAAEAEPVLAASAPVTEDAIIPEKAAAAAVICPNCGTELSSGAKFCRSCGTKIV